MNAASLIFEAQNTYLRNLQGHCDLEAKRVNKTVAPFSAPTLIMTLQLPERVAEAVLCGAESIPAIARQF
jgi:hypothetical protein